MQSTAGIYTLRNVSARYRWGIRVGDGTEHSNGYLITARVRNAIRDASVEFPALSRDSEWPTGNGGLADRLPDLGYALLESRLPHLARIVGRAPDERSAELESCE
jgi:hypothetical protein